MICVNGHLTVLERQHLQYAALVRFRSSMFISFTTLGFSFCILRLIKLSFCCFFFGKNGRTARQPRSASTPRKGSRRSHSETEHRHSCQRLQSSVGNTDCQVHDCTNTTDPALLGLSSSICRLTPFEKLKFLKDFTF